MRIRALIAALSAGLVALVPVSQAQATNPPPPKTLQSPGIDAHLGYKPQKTCSPAARPGTTALLKALIATWGGSSWGISRFCASGGTSEHKEGRALDWHMDSRKAKDRAKVNDVIKWITSNNGEVAYRLGRHVHHLEPEDLVDLLPGTRLAEDVRPGLPDGQPQGSRAHLTVLGRCHGADLVVDRPGTHGAQARPVRNRVVRQVPAKIDRSSVRSWPNVRVGPFSPYPSTAPEIAGSPRVGLALRAVPGTWTPAGATPAYQWLRDRKPISGAAAVDYQVAAADIGRALSVRVSATLGATTMTKTSPGTTDAVRGILPTPRPDGRRAVQLRLDADRNARQVRHRGGAELPVAA